MSHTAYLSLGTNIGNKENNLLVAIEKINSRIGTVTSQSSFIATSPWGFDSEHDFLNACICISTELSPIGLLDACQAIEREMGRTLKSSSQQMPDGSVRHVYHDRIIDIDILLYDTMKINIPRLTIPHSQMFRRKFVLEPLAEIAPNLIIPETSKSVSNLLQEIL